MRPRLHLLQDDDEPFLTIFIHGYLAARTADDKFDQSWSISTLRLPGKVYLLRWPSGTWSGFAKGGPLHFEKYQAHAEQIGRRLPGMIRKILGSPRHQVDLVGHSLGGRIIHSALLHGGWNGIRLRNVMLMAAKTPAHREEGAWDQALAPIGGRLFNLYSQKDGVLSLPVIDELCAGETQLRLGAKRVVNIHTGLGHSDYWDELPALFRHSKMPRYRPSKTNSAPAHCPTCEMTLIVKPDQKTECPACRSRFRYSYQDWRPYYDREHPEPLELACPRCSEGPLIVQGSAEYFCPDCHEGSKVWRQGYRLTFEETCDACEGSGYFECDKCDGKAWVECKNCDGEGEIECGVCDGDGCGRCSGGTRQCKRCEGEGKIPCRYCDEDGDRECTECGGHGMTRMTCAGGNRAHGKDVIQKGYPSSALDWESGIQVYQRRKAPRALR